ncbi:hypothetical protein LEP1GSC008_3909 [Leptospira kirschneri serovar Bulgarica str. Nikolaevo]|uniref:Uncharacterized protein n=1 Tax=Leptospira kirschneri serovar Bulgarica str. Nikolaevo TaxID=1240687 RepID=M6FBD2_9LEPT|nr:hypothetical protein LEP1GSC008_3909 [Leptospira kirschneri serovar Bulgarica str. Nikolaevo]
MNEKFSKEHLIEFYFVIKRLILHYLKNILEFGILSKNKVFLKPL